MSTNILVSLPEEVCVELLDEGSDTAEAVLQPRGPVLDVVLQVINDASAFVSLVGGSAQVAMLLRKLVKWRSDKGGGDTIDIKLRDGFELHLDPKSLNEQEIAKVTELIMQHLPARAPERADDPSSDAVAGLATSDQASTPT